MMQLSSSRAATRGVSRAAAAPAPAALGARTLPRRCRRAGTVVVAAAGGEGEKSGGWLEGAINALTVAVKESPLNKGKKMLAKAQAGAYDEAAVKAKLQATITSAPVVIFSFSTCPFCKRAKALLESLGARYTALELNEMGPEGLQLRAELAEMTDRTSMPSIWIGGSFVGGCNDGPGVAPLHRDGKLVPLLTQAGALR